uniref:DUF1618 domain-containing protein n=1 Tax=Oryza punctata TaxID=4537 RepID=A0A0E0LP42_ORYPU
MGLSRQFLNLIVNNRFPGAVSLLSVDLRRHKLFNTTTPALPLNRYVRESERPQDATHWPCAANANNQKKNKQARAPTLKMGMIRLPAPIIEFEASAMGPSWTINCSPLTDRKLLCTDNHGRHLLFDAETRQVEDLPNLNKLKSSPYSIFIPGADTNDTDHGGGSIYIIEQCPNHERQQLMLSGQFEAFVHGRSTWYCQLLPPPPFIYDPKYKRPNCPNTISSYAVLVDDCGSSHICISVDHVGTYCLDTVKHTWIKVGEWTLPFTGKVEYVPELKLWFGICTNGWQLGAIDLSSILSTTMDSQPQLVGTCKELEAPQHWDEMYCPQLANLGSGRFCIARFFRACITPMVPSSFCYDSIEERSFTDSDSDSPSIEERSFTVLTGTDVVPCVHDGNVTGNACSNANSGNNTNGSNGKVELRMIKHNSKSHMSNGKYGRNSLVF